MPSLSLAVACKGLIDARAFWQSIVPMITNADIEVHLAYDSAEQLEGMPQKVVPLFVESASVFQMWGAAIARSSSDYVAILHAACPVSEQWIDAISQAMIAGKPLICGPVEAQYERGDRRWVGYLVEYAQFHRPSAATLQEIPGNNFVLQRQLCGSKADLPVMGFSKTRLLPDWQERNIEICRVEAAIVRHERSLDYRSYRARRYYHGRAYATERVAHCAGLKRAALILTTPLVAPLRVYRIARHCLRVPRLRKPFLRFLPAIVLSELGWALGELAGYVSSAKVDDDCLD